MSNSRLSRFARAAEIGLKLPHSEESLTYLKRENIGLYFILKKIKSTDEMKFDDIMILEHSGYYSCPLCNSCQLYSVVFGNARKHFESHLLDIERILEFEKEMRAINKRGENH